MNFAIISDIHRNLETLNTVLKDAEARGCKKTICGVDMMGYHANPKEYMDIVSGLDFPCVIGNHHEDIGQECELSAFNPVVGETVMWTREQLTFYERAHGRTLQLDDGEIFWPRIARVSGPRVWKKSP